MNTNNFNATELSTIYKTLNGLDSAFDAYLIPALPSVGSGGGTSEYYVLKSEDSDLYQTWYSLALTVETIRDKMKEIREKIQEEITTYAQKTIENETSTSQDISDINTSLETYKEELSKIDLD